MATFASTVSATLPIEQRTRAELLLYIHMLYTKLPLDFPQIIQMLKDRGLNIINDTKAIEQLQVISYFRLANYLRPMEQDKMNHTFKANSYFENALDLYYFDKELRTLIFTAVQSVEIALRAKMVHHISLKYGAFWFTNASLFANNDIHQGCLSQIEQELSRSREDFIQEHFAKYSVPDIPPVWKTLEVTSFGTLSKLFCNLADISIKKKIAREFNLPQHKVLESWIKCIVVLRNCLAHHTRVWNRNFPIMPQMTASLRGAWVTPTGFPLVKVYSQLCCLAYFENHIHPNNDFKPRLQALLKKYPNVDTAAMGFPKNWESEPLWR